MIALGCDHGGFELKQEIIAYLKARKIEYKDFGCYDNKSVDYPVYAKLVGKAIQSGASATPADQQDRQPPEYRKSRYPQAVRHPRKHNHIGTSPAPPPCAQSRRHQSAVTFL